MYYLRGAYHFFPLSFLIPLNSIPFPYHFLSLSLFLKKVEKSEFISSTLFSQLITEKQRHHPGLTNTELGNNK